MLSSLPLQAEVRAAEDSVLGILDYRYAPYALGDTFTWLTNLHVLANEAARTHVDLAILTLPDAPSSRLQPHITPHNYLTFIESLMPAFWCGPAVRSLRIYERNRKMAQRLLGALKAGTPSWPRLRDHFRHRLHYSTHQRINAFYEREGWLPRLTSPPGYRQEVAAFKKANLSGKQACLVNIRQRRLTHDPTAVDRDSPASEWYHFFLEARSRWPNVVFLLLGGFSEWERPFIRLDNVLIPRVYGLGLGHELTFLLDGTPFVGTSSGFSAAATFSTTPYVITNFEEKAARYIGLPAGTHRYPFAVGPQSLSWEQETSDLLLKLFADFWPQACIQCEREDAA